MTQRDYQQIFDILATSMAKIDQLRERVDTHLMQCSQCPYWYENTLENFPSLSDDGEPVCSECTAQYLRDAWGTYEDDIRGSL